MLICKSCNYVFAPCDYVGSISVQAGTSSAWTTHCISYRLRCRLRRQHYDIVYDLVYVLYGIGYQISTRAWSRWFKLDLWDLLVVTNFSTSIASRRGRPCGKSSGSGPGSGELHASKEPQRLDQTVLKCVHRSRHVGKEIGNVSFQVSSLPLMG
jgi:hypothetical protein